SEEEIAEAHAIVSLRDGSRESAGTTTKVPAIARRRNMPGILQLHEQRERDAVLGLPQVRRPSLDKRAGRAGVSTRRCDAAFAGEIWRVRVPIVVFGAERHELARHEVERGLGIPGLEEVARVIREIRRSRKRRGAVDWRHQHQIAARVVDRASADGERESILVEPEALIRHESEKVLRWRIRGAAATADAAP